MELDRKRREAIRLRLVTLGEDTKEEGYSMGWGILPEEWAVRAMYSASQHCSPALGRSVHLADWKTRGTTRRVVRNPDSTPEGRRHACWLQNEGRESRLEPHESPASFLWSVQHLYQPEPSPQSGPACFVRQIHTRSGALLQEVWSVVQDGVGHRTASEQGTDSHYWFSWRQHVASGLDWGQDHHSWSPYPHQVPTRGQRCHLEEKEPIQTWPSGLLVQQLETWSDLQQGGVVSWARKSPGSWLAVAPAPPFPLQLLLRRQLPACPGKKCDSYQIQLFYHSQGAQTDYIGRFLHKDTPSTQWKVTVSPNFIKKV